MMDLLYYKWFDSNAIDNLSIILSIGSFLLGILVFMQTYAIKNHYIKNVRIFEINKDLDELAREIYLLLKDKNTGVSLLKCFARAKGIMIKLKKTAIGEDKEEVVKYLASYSDFDTSIDKICWDAYGSICFIGEMLRQSKNEKIIL